MRQEDLEKVSTEGLLKEINKRKKAVQAALDVSVRVKKSFSSLS